MSGYQASKSVALYPMAASSKTLSFAIETNNFLEESDNWEAWEPSNRKCFVQTIAIQLQTESQTIGAWW